jgi:hypothetical protein
VTEYTQRDLTIEGDRLAALTSIESTIGRHLEDQLVAGLWRDRFARHFLWWVLPKDPKVPLPGWTTPFPFSQSRNPSYQRPTSYRAPTWSWAPVLGPVTYAQLYIFLMVETAMNPTMLEIVPSVSKAEVTVKDVILHVEPVGRNMSGYVTLCGSLFKASATIRYGAPELTAAAVCAACQDHPSPQNHRSARTT